MTVLTHTPAILVGTGAFADVFRYDSRTVVKLFRRNEVTHDPVQDLGDHEVVIRAVWDAEATAYESIAAKPDLARFLAPFHGRISISDVVNTVGVSISGAYLLDCGVRLSLVPGRASKVGIMQDHPLFPEIDAFLDALYEAGIRHPYDSSVFIPGLGERFTVVDIGSWDALAELSEALALNGRLSDEARARWRFPAA